MLRSQTPEPLKQKPLALLTSFQTFEILLPLEKRIEEIVPKA